MSGAFTVRFGGMADDSAHDWRVNAATAWPAATGEDPGSHRRALRNAASGKPRGADRVLEARRSRGTVLAQKSRDEDTCHCRVAGLPLSLATALRAIVPQAVV
jgi:hypothetical protein